MKKGDRVVFLHTEHTDCELWGVTGIIRDDTVIGYYIVELDPTYRHLCTFVTVNRYDIVTYVPWMEQELP